MKATNLHVLERVVLKVIWVTLGLALLLVLFLGSGEP